MKKIVIIVFLIVVLVAIAVLTGQGNKFGNPEEEKIVLEGDPVDITMDFYGAWLDSRKITGNPFADGVAEHKTLSPDFSAELLATQEIFNSTGNDPVLCGITIPDSLKTKTVLHTDDSAQVMLLARGELSAPIAVAKLGGVDGQWKIVDISCNASEEGPEIGEFNFEKSGRLLKDSVKPPLDSNYWYLIYERDGVIGYTAQLTLTDSSVCSQADGSPVECGGSEFYETMAVDVKGNMTEAGLEVVQIQISEE